LGEVERGRFGTLLVMMRESTVDVLLLLLRGTLAIRELDALDMSAWSERSQ
jgi:hypothetical protein